jgi:NitT/TauT family transport system substrate-binding protein
MLSKTERAGKRAGTYQTFSREIAMRSACALAIIVALAGLALIGSNLAPARAAEKIRAAKSIDVLWVYTPLDVGIAEGIFAKYGVDVELSVMSGGARFHQALLSNSVDIGLDGATSMALAVKGAGDLAVAAYAGAPYNFSLNVAADSPIRSAADLKGKLLGVASNGSLPEWLTKRVSIAERWGPSGIRTTATGGFEATLAATLSHSIDGFIGAREAGLLLQQRGRGRVVFSMEKYVAHLISQAVFARKELIEKHPDLVERFLKGLFASVQYVRTHKEKSVEIATRVLHQDPRVMDKVYDLELPMLSKDGTFDAKALAVVKKSHVEMRILPHEPRNDQLFTARFVPVRP